MEFKTGAALLGILIVLIYAFGSGIWVNNSPGWYSSLNRPPWQPPDFVFGLIWPYNFIVLGVAAFRIPTLTTRTGSITWLIYFVFSVVAALSWAYNFYGPHNLKFATYSLAAATLLTIPMLVIGFKAAISIGILLLPYQIWIAIATTLAWGYASRN